MNDTLTGCPERPLFPPENTEEPEWYDWSDEIYQLYQDGRYENESL